MRKRQGWKERRCLDAGAPVESTKSSHAALALQRTSKVGFEVCLHDLSGFWW